MIGDMAHLPGTGPDDTRCGECSYYQRRREADMYGSCRKAAAMRRKLVGQLEPIPANQFSCKYFAKV